jgi:hypothetical protein
LVERNLAKVEVASSRLVSRSRFLKQRFVWRSKEAKRCIAGPCRTMQDHAGVAQLVERNLAKVEVASSRLVSRSRHSGKQRFPFCLVDQAAIEQICEPVVAGSAVRLRRDSKAVMQRPAKPFRPVRLRLAPPAVKEKPRLVGAFLFSVLLAWAFAPCIQFSRCRSCASTREASSAPHRWLPRF